MRGQISKITGKTLGASNKTRAGRAAVALRGYAGNKYRVASNYDMASSIIDMLADIQHLCDTDRLNFGHLWEVARSHYEEEKVRDDCMKH